MPRACQASYLLTCHVKDDQLDISVGGDRIRNAYAAVEGIRICRPHRYRFRYCPLFFGRRRQRQRSCRELEVLSLF